jgi:hypothetical protein
MPCATRQCPSHCPLRMQRRDFVAAMGASAAALKVGLFDFASSLFGQEQKPAHKPVVRAVFMHPKTDGYWMGWPGAGYDIKARRADYVRTLTDAAGKLGVQLQLAAEPVSNQGELNTLLEQLKQSPPDGLVVTMMSMDCWGMVDKLVAQRGDVPTIVFSPMGTSFTGHLQPTRKAPRTFVAATQDYRWLAESLRMLSTIWQMKKTRLLIVAGNKTEDRELGVIGSTLHYIPGSRFPEEFKKTETSDEMRAIARYYTKEAKKIVEPNQQDILNAAKNYVVIRRLMAAENCGGYSMDCLTPISRREMWPPCLAYSRLRDECIVAACEADWNAAISSRLTHLLFNRPGFMQDPAPNTVNNTLMGAHCTCATKLAGPDKPHQPFILRSHSESNLGVAMQVLWPVGEKVTVMKFEGPGRIILGTGRVVANIDTPPSGGCRTSVELAIDNVADSRDCKGFHQLFILGRHDRPLKAYCQLAGIEVVPIG